jgi:histidyl-tRNA synthetase
VFIAALGDAAEIEGLRLAEELRREGYWAEPHYGGTSLKSQLRRADRLGADYALIIGDDELASGMVKWKNLKEGTQGEIPLAEVPELIRPRPGV